MQHHDRRSSPKTLELTLTRAPAPIEGRPAGRVLTLALLAVLVLLVPAPAAALVAVIEIAAPVDGAASEDDIRAALRAALGTALSGAEAMGLPGVHVLSARLDGRTITVKVMAADGLLAGTDRGALDLDGGEPRDMTVLPASIPPGDALSPRGAVWLCEPRSPRLQGR